MKLLQNWWCQGLLLVHPLGLPQFEDLTVVQGIHLVAKELEGGRLGGQCPCDLLPYHLHDLEHIAQGDVIQVSHGPLI